MLDRAKATFHSTSIEAATIAKKANAGKLIIGHFSARYKDLNPMLQEARTIFPETELALEGNKFSVAEKKSVLIT
jgi:ribonuclease Z